MPSPDYDDFEDSELFDLLGLKRWKEPPDDDVYKDIDPRYYNPHYVEPFIQYDIDHENDHYGVSDSSMYGWPGRMARLRDYIRMNGFENLPFDAQVEMLLFYIMPNEDTEKIMALAKRIADHFGTMARMVFSRKKAFDPLNLPPRVLKWLLTITHMVRTYLRLDNQRHSYKSVFRYFDLLKVVGPMRHQQRWPSTCVMYADFEYHLMGMETVSESTYWTDPQIARHIIRQCVGLRARYIFLLLFCGPYPVEMDDEEREYLVSFAQVLKAVKVLLLDCVIISEFGIKSLHYDEKFDILHREADWRRTHKPFLPNWNTPAGCVGPEVGEDSIQP